jgi:hypothetical protein
MGEELAEKLQLFEGCNVKWMCDLNGLQLSGRIKNIVGIQARIELPSGEIRWVRLIQLKRMN